MLLGLLLLSGMRLQRILKLFIHFQFINKDKILFNLYCQELLQVLNWQNLQQYLEDIDQIKKQII